MLETLGGNHKSKEHYARFKETEWGDEGCLPFVTFLDANVVIASSYVELSESRELLEVVDEIRDKG